MDDRSTVEPSVAAVESLAVEDGMSEESSLKKIEPSVEDEYILAPSVIVNRSSVVEDEVKEPSLEMIEPSVIVDGNGVESSLEVDMLSVVENV